MVCVNPTPTRRGASICVWRPYCGACEQDSHCSEPGGRCIEDDAGEGFCSRVCELEGDSCPIGSTCEDVPGVGLYCKPVNGACLADGLLCEPCLFHSDCQEGAYCLSNPFTREKFCSQPCDRDNPCPRNYECDSGQCVPPMASCFPPSPGGFCEQCRMSDDCTDDGLCIYDQGLSVPVCATGCSLDPASCPLGSVCQPLFDQQQNFAGLACVPDGGCVAALDCAEVECEPGQYCFSGRCRNPRDLCSSCRPQNAAVCGPGNFCAPLDDELTRCLQGCIGAPDACPEGTACTEFFGPQGEVIFSACRPDAGVCGG